eukprot:33498_1
MLASAIRRLTFISPPSACISRFMNIQQSRFMATVTTKNDSTVIDVLNHHHAVIGKTLSAFASFAQVLKSGDQQSGALLDDLHKFVRFFKEYSDVHHHNIEEHILFPGIREYGFSLIENHGGVYLKDEHDMNRDYISAIVQGIRNDTIDREIVAHRIEDFVEFLGGHAWKEDHQLYPEIENKVPKEAMQKISQQTMLHLEKHKESEQELLDLSDELAKKYWNQQPIYIRIR